MQIVRCISCDGYGWFREEYEDEAEECDWCGGIGYVFRDASGIDQRILPEQLVDPSISALLEQMETERMQQMGYRGEARKPWEQRIRQGTRGGINPYQDSDAD
jgi:hypothetical protein